MTICVCLRGLFFFIIAFGLVDLQTCSAQEEKPRARVREVGRVRSPRKYEQRDWRDLSTVVCVTQIQPPHGRTHIRFYAVAVSFFFFLLQHAQRFQFRQLRMSREQDCGLGELLGDGSTGAGTRRAEGPRNRLINGPQVTAIKVACQRRGSQAQGRFSGMIEEPSFPAALGSADNSLVLFKGTSPPPLLLPALTHSIPLQ